MRPVAQRETSRPTTAPEAVRRVAQAASSTVTGSGPSSPVRVGTNVVSVPETDVTGESRRKRTWSTAWEARSPSAPDPAVSRRRRQVMGACSSASQSCR